MKPTRLTATVVSASLVASGVLLVPVAAHADGDDGQDRRIEVVKVIDTAKRDHSLVRVRYRDSMRGRVVKVSAESKLLAGGVRRNGGAWLQNPSDAIRYFKPIGWTEFRVRLPATGNTAKIAIPFDVAQRPPARFAPRKADAIRLTLVDVLRRSQYDQMGTARIMTVRKGDPANYFWQDNRISRVWDRGPDSDHAHRIIKR